MNRSKKILIIVFIFLLIVTACDNNTNQNNNGDTNNNNEEPSNISIIDYFPFTENTRYSYEGEGNEYATYTVYTDYISENRIQLRTNNGGTETVDVYDYKDGQLSLLMSRPETYFRENFIDIADNNAEVILKEPLEAGNSWTTRDNLTSTITGTDKEVITPLGTYKALEVTTEHDDGKTVEYYAEEIGLVKRVFTGGNYEVTSILNKLEENTPLVQNITLFYPDIDGNNLNSINVQISFNTNDEPIEIIENTIKDLSYEVISPDAKINSLSFDETNNRVNVDFSKEFVSGMNAGSGFEDMILQSITNTLGVYYGVEDVYITIDGSPYESGHITMNENEPFKVDLSNVKEVK